MTESDVGRFPNIINKKKLTPLPLFRQNLSPERTLFQSPKNLAGYGFNSKSTGLLPATATAASAKKLYSDLRTVNNYGRLCDQPFLEYSAYHLKQVFGHGSGQKKIILEPIKRPKYMKKELKKLYTIKQNEPEQTKPKASVKVHEITEEPNAEDLVEKYVGEEPEVQEQEQEGQDLTNQTTIRRIYQIDDNYEMMIGFVSLEAILHTPEGAVSAFLGKNDLLKIYENSDEEMAEIVTNCLVYKNGDLKITLRDNALRPADPTDDDECYPEKKTVKATVNGQEFDVTIMYPYLEATIPRLNYKEKLCLRPRYLANLYDANFENLEDYVRRFHLPAELLQDETELHNAELQSLPTIVKKAVKTDNFEGMIIFKSLEVHLNNTMDTEPLTSFNKSDIMTPRTRKIYMDVKKEVNNVLLRLKLSDLAKICRCSAEEVAELVKKSLSVEEFQGFIIRLDEELTAQYVHRHNFAADSLPEESETFTMRFNKFVYQGYVKFPTLELYIPGTNYKDVIQLTPSQIKEITDSSCKNLDSYLNLFKPAGNSVTQEEADPKSEETDQGETKVETEEAGQEELKIEAEEANQGEAKVETEEADQETKLETEEANQGEVNVKTEETNQEEEKVETEETAQVQTETEAAEVEVKQAEQGETKVETEEVDQGEIKVEAENVQEEASKVEEVEPKTTELQTEENEPKSVESQEVEDNQNTEKEAENLGEQQVLTEEGTKSVEVEADEATEGDN